MNIKELENNMTKENIFSTFANLKSTNERLEFIDIMKNFYPNVYDINWTNVEENVMNEA
tara:strand:+ start:125 stop:301 length:177 start_codon:yes stop_codon:yes gene_type:complete